MYFTCKFLLIMKAVGIVCNYLISLVKFFSHTCTKLITSNALFNNLVP